MAELGLSIAADDFVGFRWLEELFMLLWRALLANGDLSL